MARTSTSSWYRKAIPALAPGSVVRGQFHAQLAALGFAVGPSPELSIVVFRWAPVGVSPERADELNQALLDGVRRDGRVFLSSTLLDSRFTLRMAALAHRTHLRTIDLALQILREQIAVFGA